MGNCRCYCSFSFNGNILGLSFLKMKIASLSENLNNEKRVSITPDTVKKFKTLEFEVSLPEG